MNSYIEKQQKKWNDMKKKRDDKENEIQQLHEKKNQQFNDFFTKIITICNNISNASDYSELDDNIFNMILLLSDDNEIKNAEEINKKDIINEKIFTIIENINSNKNLNFNIHTSDPSVLAHVKNIGTAIKKILDFIGHDPNSIEIIHMDTDNDYEYAKQLETNDINIQNDYEYAKKINNSSMFHQDNSSEEINNYDIESDNSDEEMNYG